VRLWVDKRRIERVLTNLVDNAAQYAGGVVRLAVERSGDGVRFVVADRGPGVAESERDRIFERFYRGQAAGQRGVADGTGLGLSLVAEHVRLHGGRVWVEPGGNGETRFVFELPAGEHDRGRAPTAAAAPAGAPPAPPAAASTQGPASGSGGPAPAPAPALAPDPGAVRAPDTPVS
jgi:light-regulated signal transduction histidine kinase (bacteriophytochrome)